MNRRHFLTTAAALACSTSLRAADDKLRVAVIGHTGRGDYGHGLDVVWQQFPEVEIIAVADADAAGLAKAQKRLKLETGFADYKAMLAQSKPDIVAICPRHVDQHRDMVLASIEAGARGIYMEKPFCRTPAEADQIVAACEAKGMRLALAHRNRYHPALKQVEQMLKDGAIGQLLELRGRGKEDQRGGGLDLWVLGSHVMNLANFIGGKPLACSATILQDGRPITRADVKEGAEGVGPLAGNQLHARYEMQIGVPFYFDSIAKAGIPAANFGLQLIGNKGIIDLRVDTEPLAQMLEGNPTKPTQDARAWVPISSAGLGKPEPIQKLGNQVGSHRLAAQDLIAAIREKREPLCNATEGRTTIEMIHAVFESHRLNGQRVPWPLQTRENALGLL